MATRKTTSKNPSKEISEAISAPLEGNLYDYAVSMGLTLGELRERLAAKLDNDDPLDWETLPIQHEATLKEIERELEAQATVRKLNAEASVPEPEVPEPEVEIPMLIEEETKPAGKLDKPKTPSTALTNGRKQALDKTKEVGKKAAKGVEDAILISKAQKGRKRGAKKATVELLAEEETYHETMTNAAYQQLADEIRETADESSFDPYWYIRQAGSQDVDETLKTAVEKITPVLEVLGKSADEIVDNSYSNGSELDLSRLMKLMQSDA